MATQNRPLFFARKFEHIIDSEIIDFVELRFMGNNFALEHVEENFYLQNIYHSSYDNNFNQFYLDFYHYFANESLKLIKTNDTEFNFNLNNLKLIESNLIFQRNKYFGTLLRFNIENYFKIELLLKKFSNDTILLPHSINPILKSIKVICIDFNLEFFY